MAPHSGHGFLPATGFLKLQRKLLNRMHLARDGEKNALQNIQALTRAQREVRASIIVDFETSQVFCLHALFQICTSLSK